MQSRQRDDPRFQEQFVVMERRIVQALFEQIWWQVTGDAERRRDAVARVELLQQQLAVHRQQRPPWPCKGPV